MAAGSSENKRISHYSDILITLRNVTVVVVPFSVKASNKRKTKNLSNWIYTWKLDQRQDGEKKQNNNRNKWIKCVYSVNKAYYTRAANIYIFTDYF